jgi:hypothetical protein
VVFFNRVSDLGPLVAHRFETSTNIMNANRKNSTAAEAAVPAMTATEKKELFSDRAELLSAGAYAVGAPTTNDDVRAESCTPADSAAALKNGRSILARVNDAFAAGDEAFDKALSRLSKDWGTRTTLPVAAVASHKTTCTKKKTD